MDEQTSILSMANELLKEVIDPEIGINIVDLGLVYELSLSEHKEIKVTMTLTTPGCPMSNTITGTVTNLLGRHLPGYTVKVDLVWFPAWEPEMITEEGQRQLDGGFFGTKKPEKTGSIWDNLFT
ncbi:metal-sulfur cluster assembly factor [Adhaeribacter terrigena]|nr:metal-sulfur cluster assembly factor [Adhaeribacter terrigena]